MNYNFPVINDISQIREAIKGRSEFIEAQKDDYIVFNYTFSSNETFPAVNSEQEALLRECRGIIFDLNGKCIRRPYHKFFNLGEKEESVVSDISTFSVLEKLDGSMVSPFYSNGKIRWGTKMGITKYTDEIEKLVTHKLERFAFYCLSSNITPIFEWCSNKNRIVLSYPEDKLVLTAMRNNVNGEYAQYRELEYYFNNYFFDIVKQFDSFSEEAIAQAEETEGVVLRSSYGHMIKVKSAWYVNLHKAKEAISSERYVINMIFSNQLDDILPKLQEKDQEQVKKYQDKVVRKFKIVSDVVDISIKSLLSKYPTPKEFGLYSQNNKTIDPLICGIVFKKLKDPDLVIKQLLIDTLLRHTNNNRGLEKVSWFYDNEKWNYGDNE